MCLHYRDKTIILFILICVHCSLVHIEKDMLYHIWYWLILVLTDIELFALQKEVWNSGLFQFSIVHTDIVNPIVNHTEFKSSISLINDINIKEKQALRLHIIKKINN